MFITFYKTFREHPEEYQLTFEDFLNGVEFTITLSIIHFLQKFFFIIKIKY